MDNITAADVVLNKKFDGYGYTNNDFIAANEITVTITLAEYRKLVSEAATATSRIDEANKNKHARDSENKSLKEELQKLKADLYELRKKFDDESEKEEE